MNGSRKRATAGMRCDVHTYISKAARGRSGAMRGAVCGVHIQRKPRGCLQTLRKPLHVQRSGFWQPGVCDPARRWYLGCKERTIGGESSVHDHGPRHPSLWTGGCLSASRPRCPCDSGLPDRLQGPGSQQGRQGRSPAVHPVDSQAVTLNPQKPPPGRGGGFFMIHSLCQRCNVGLSYIESDRYPDMLEYLCRSGA